MCRRAATLILALCLALVASPGLAVAESLTTIPPEVDLDELAGNIDAGLAESFAFEAHLGLLGDDVVDLSPFPAVTATVQGAGFDNARDSYLEVGPVPDVEREIAEVIVAEVTADVDLAPPLSDVAATSTGDVAHASAEVTDVDLLAVLNGGGADAGAGGEALPDLPLFAGEAAPAVPGLVQADKLRAEATAVCAPQTAEEASAGTQLVNVVVAGQPITDPIPINTVIEVPGVARVTLNAVERDANGVGWTVTALRVQTLDPLTGLTNDEITVAEVHVSLTCIEEGEPEPPVDPPLPLPLDVVKTVRGPSVVEPGDDVTYEVQVINATEDPCQLYRVVEMLPGAFDLVAVGEDLADVHPRVEADGRRLVYDTDRVLAPGEALTATFTVTVPEDIRDGIYWNSASADGVCGRGHGGLQAPVVIDPTDPPTPPTGPCDAPSAPSPNGFQQVNGVSDDDPADFTVRLSNAVIDRASAAVIAREDTFPDALAASGLAAELCAPLFVNPVDALSSSVRTQLADLGVTDVYLVGGESAQSPAVEQQLVADGYDVTRIGGGSRYETAVEVARAIVAIGGPVDSVTVARANDFPDAMSGANLATWRRSPIILTDTPWFNEPSADGLPSILAPGANRIIIAGGPAAVSVDAENEMRALGYATERRMGESRFGTSKAILDLLGVEGSARPRGTATGTDLFNPVFVAAGNDFVAALSGGVAAYISGGSLLLVNQLELADSRPAQEHLENHAEIIDVAALLGSSAEISTRVEGQILDAIRAESEER